MSNAMVRANTMSPLATTTDEPPRGPEVLREFLAFKLADETYALPLGSVREILKPPPITEVPRAPADILGIVSVRGRVTTVIDLRRRLRLSENAIHKQSRVLLVDNGEEVLGLLVDVVLHVYRLRDEEIEIAAVVGGDTADYVLGIGRPRSARILGRRMEVEIEVDHDILILLDPGPLLRR